jgi:hypothetical protein
LARSVLGFTQAALQSVSPAAQVAWQLPSEQTWPMPQTVPQPPQFIGSDRVSTHMPLQSRPVVQTAPVSTTVPSLTFASAVVESGAAPSMP